MRIVRTEDTREFYSAVGESDVNAETYIATLMTGDEAGSKALISSGEVSMILGRGGFLSEHSRDLASFKETGIVTLDGHDIYMELQGNEPSVVICGAGHVSMPIIEIARMMNLNITVIDDRQEFIDNAALHGADRTICKPFDEAMKEIESDEDTYFVVVTRGHNYDSACVGGALRKKHAYVGMIGSKRHGKMVRDKLIEDGIPVNLIDSVYTPIGLEIEAETPEEIAVAIMAEIIQIKNGKRKNIGLPKGIMKAILDEERGPAILSTIIEKTGSGPRTVGSKMLIYADGSIEGTIGGGIAENEIIGHAVKLIESGFSGAEVLKQDLIARADESGMVCGGKIKVMIEAV